MAILSLEYDNTAKVKKEAKLGEAIIKGTNFKKSTFKRKLAQLNFKIGQEIKDFNNQNYIVIGYDEEYLLARPLTHFTKTGRIKKRFCNKIYNINPIHCKQINK